MRVIQKLLLSLGIMLSGCTSYVHYQGFNHNVTQISSLKKGVSKQSGVLSLLGRPSWTPFFDNSIWCYITQNTNINAIESRSVNKITCYVLQWTPEGILKDIAILNNYYPCPMDPHQSAYTPPEKKHVPVAKEEMILLP